MERAVLNVTPSVNSGKKATSLGRWPGQKATKHQLLVLGFALAWTVGFIAAGVLVVTPAGLRVREVALLIVMGSVVAGSGAVAAVVLLSRTVHTLSDGAWALVGIGWRASRPAGSPRHQPVSR